MHIQNEMTQLIFDDSSRAIIPHMMMILKLQSQSAKLQFKRTRTASLKNRLCLRSKDEYVTLLEKFPEDGKSSFKKPPGPESFAIFKGQLININLYKSALLFILLTMIGNLAVQSSARYFSQCCFVH